MKTGLIVVISIVLVLVIVIVIFMAMKSSSKKAADAASPVAPPAAPTAECLPFTKAQQDAEKTKLRSKCASKLLIPFVGQIQYYSCLKQIPTQLTPVKNC